MGFFDRFKKRKKAVEELAERDEARAKRSAPKVSVERETPFDSGDSSAGSAKKENRGAAYRILLRPLVSEKAAGAERHAVYTFMVAPGATKSAVKDAVAAVYGVKPVSVNTMQMTGKQVRFGGRIGQRKNWKKAIVTLPEGKSISIHEGV